MTPLPTLRQKLDIINVYCPVVGIRIRTINVVSVLFQQESEHYILVRIKMEFRPLSARV